MEIVIVNGKFAFRSEVKIDMEDRGYQFGDGVYEVIRVYNGKMFTANEHLQRLIESGKKIKLNIPYTVEEMKEMLNKLIDKNNLILGTIYMQVTRGVASRNHIFPGDHVQPILVANTKSVLRPLENMNTGVKTIINEDIRWLLCDIKSLNLLGNVMAKQKAVEAGCFEAIQHRDGVVTECSSSNIFIVREGKVITHPANHLILNGITRQKILEICRKNDIPYVETAFTLDELRLADEVFISGTTSEITPVIEIEGNKVGDGTLGPIIKRLQELFEKEIEKECGHISVEA